jgi:phage-related protein
MRLSGRDGVARAIYSAAVGRRLVAVHVFVKKSEKTPRAAIELAFARAREAGLR